MKSGIKLQDNMQDTYRQILEEAYKIWNLIRAVIQLL